MNRGYVSFTIATFEITLLLLLEIPEGLAIAPVLEKGPCGYESCPKGKPNMLNVHVIAHSHDDVGWLKTMEEYYYGERSSIQVAGVQYILDTVMKELAFDPNKTFSYCESAFLSKWYNSQPKYIQEIFKGLINNGQMTIIGGGWSQNDEAVTHYSSIIDQMTLGFNFLENAFGECARPRVGWQIDPFGHSKELNSLFSQMGFDGEFCGRWDYEDIKYRRKNKEMEFIWKGSENLGQSSQLFNVILPNVYWWPSALCFDPACQSISPVVDDKESELYNANKFAEIFIKQSHEYSKWYKTNNVILTMGLDFTFQNADMTFKNIDKVLKAVNELQQSGSKVNAFYSSPNCYLKAVNEAGEVWNVKDDDDFPLGEASDMYWTGYYTSRPAAKYQERYSNNILQICKQMSAISNYFLHPEKTTFDKNVYKLREAVGVMQHHDAITGTARQRVANDYSKLMSGGILSCQVSIVNAYNHLMVIEGHDEINSMQFCHLLNASECHITTLLNNFTVVIYNPLSWPIEVYVHLPVLPSIYKVYNHTNHKVSHQLLPLSRAMLSLPEHKLQSTLELVFPVTVPPVGFNTYFVSTSKSAMPMRTNHLFITPSPGNSDFEISNKFIRLEFNGETGLLKSYESLLEEIIISLNQSFYYYKSESESGRLSGAYLFRPHNNKVYALASKLFKPIIIIKGPLVQEVHQVFNNWTTQIIRLRKDQTFVEFDWIVGPIPNEKFIGTEIITRFDTNLESDGIFYTDANGREMVKRIRNKRKSWETKVTEPITSNYYPVTSKIYIQDRDAEIQFTVLTDRSQGGSSIKDGSIELMVHRRIFQDDNLGVGEDLNEYDSDGKGLRIRGKHYVTLTSLYSASRLNRKLAQMLYMSPLLSFMKTTLSREEWTENYISQYSLLQPLPDQIHLLSLELLKGHDDLLIRLEHFYEIDEDPILSQPVLVDLKNLFFDFVVIEAKEMTLGANKKLDELQRFKFKCASEDNIDDESSSPPIKDLTITLTPMQIRTFFIKVVRWKKQKGTTSY